MASLARFPKLVGFFSYSREDDEAFKGSLSALHDVIQRDLGAQLGRSRDFRLWRDEQAIAPGEMWESEIAKAVEQSVFFIPIVTPHVVASRYCKFEFESFIARERALDRNDLVFPVHYVQVPELLDESEWRDDPVLSIVAKRQYVDWRKYCYDPVDTPAFRQAIGGFCRKIAETLRKPWISPEDRRQLAAEDKRRAEEEARTREEAKRRAEDEERVRQQAEAKRQTAERERLHTDVAKKQAGRGRQKAAFVTVVKRPTREGESRAPTNVEPLTAAQERALKAGDSFKEGADCPEMIVVPAGRFLMGSPAGRGLDRERPQHEVKIAKPFAVAKFALTFDEWDASAPRDGFRPDVSDEGWGRGRRPVINVNWDDAQAYLHWLSSITGKPYRLLAEAEWEYAARAGSQTAYPWGDDIQLNSKAMANCRDSGSQWQGMGTSPVGSFPANAFGIYDMVGNVWEWTEDCWNANYRSAPADGSPWASGDCSCHVIRGGSWANHPPDIRSAGRDGAPSINRRINAGFRVARTLTP